MQVEALVPRVSCCSRSDALNKGLGRQTDAERDMQAPKSDLSPAQAGTGWLRIRKGNRPG